MSALSTSFKLSWRNANRTTGISGPAHIINDIITAQRRKEGEKERSERGKETDTFWGGKKLEMRQRGFTESKKGWIDIPFRGSLRGHFPLFWVAGPSLILNWSPLLFPTVPYFGAAPPRCRELPCLPPLYI